MRHFDIANRLRHRFTTTVTITPVSVLDVNASVSTGNDDYDESGFGLRSNDNRSRQHERDTKQFYASPRHTLEVDFDHYLWDLERERKKGRARAAS